MADAFKPHNTGRYELVGGPDGAECRRTDAEPDLAMGVAELGALYLGGVALHRARRAPGRIEERRAGALAAGDALFADRRGALVLHRVLTRRRSDRFADRSAAPPAGAVRRPASAKRSLRHAILCRLYRSTGGQRVGTGGGGAWAFAHVFC